jgi:hypothetical protein
MLGRDRKLDAKALRRFFDGDLGHGRGSPRNDGNHGPRVTSRFNCDFSDFVCIEFACCLHTQQMRLAAPIVQQQKSASQSGGLVLAFA